MKTPYVGQIVVTPVSHDNLPAIITAVGGHLVSALVLSPTPFIITSQNYVAETTDLTVGNVMAANPAEDEADMEISTPTLDLAHAGMKAAQNMFDVQTGQFNQRQTVMERIAAALETLVKLSTNSEQPAPVVASGSEPAVIRIGQPLPITPMNHPSR